MDLDKYIVLINTENINLNSYNIDCWNKNKTHFRKMGIWYPIVNISNSHFSNNKNQNK